jgi:hypothetical protein
VIESGTGLNHSAESVDDLTWLFVAVPLVAIGLIAVFLYARKRK